MAGSVSAGSVIYEVDIDTSRLIQGRREIDAALNGLSGNMGRLETSVSRTERSIGTMQNTMSKLSGVARGLLAALSVQQVAEWGNEWVTVNNKLANSVRSTEQLSEVTQRVFDISQSTMSSLGATATLYGRLERATRSAGTSTKDLITLTSTINKGLAVSGATTAEASSTMTQLSQALASGVLRGEEFNSLSENGSRLAVALADSLGLTIGQLRSMAAEGKLTTQVVVNGLLQQSDKIAKEFANTTMTMGQAITVATNNITKFVGESSSVPTGIKAFNTGIVSLSQNLDTISNIIAALAVVMGSRFVGALSLAGAAKIKYAADTMAAAKASSIAAKDAEVEAAAKLRLAEVEKLATIETLKLAEGRLATLRTTNASVSAEVRLAEAEAAQVRTQIAQIESEKVLEAQRLKAQITEQGRIATATRMAQLQQSSAALNQRLASAEAATAQARAAAIASAEASVSSARLAAADATGVATAANARYIASQEASVIASRAAALSTGLLRGALGLLGGPAGVAMIAGAAIYYFWQKAKQAREEAIAFADGIDKLNSSLTSMNNTQLRGSIADANISIRAQQSAVDDLEKEVLGLTERYSKFTPQAAAAAERMGTATSFAREQKDVFDELNQKTRDLADKKDKLAKTEATAAEANRILTNNMLTSMGVHDSLIEKGSTLERVQGAVARAFGMTAEEINRASQAGQNFNPKALQISPPTEDGTKNILNLEEQNALLKIQDERVRAVTKAQMEQAKVTKNRNQINEAGRLAGENFDLQKQEEERRKAQQNAQSESNKAATAAESDAQKLQRLKEASEQSAESTEELSRAQAILNAQNSLSKNASAEMIRQAGEYAATKWDTANALKAQAAAEKLLPETKENASYRQDMKDLQTALDGKKITQREYDRTAERLEEQHQINLAKIRAEGVVSPTAQAKGEIDPVQQLANQHAQELAMIQQFETQKGQITQRGLELMNAANQQYEQQRIAAQWEIWRQQGLGYEVAAAAFDSFAGNASNALTGILTGSMSVNEAMRSISSTILNEVINTFVQMGVQQAKSAIMGATAQNAAIATTTAAQVGALGVTTAASATAAGTTMAAWLPAALVASIGSFGAAAVVGGGALLAAFGLITALSGKRKNGGPVSAGSMYQVGEGGMPEIYRSNSGKQYMIPGDNGSVISNSDMQSGSGGMRVTHNVYNYASGVNVQTQSSQRDGELLVETFLTDLDTGGPMSNGIQQHFGLSRKANGDL